MIPYYYYGVTAPAADKVSENRCTAFAPYNQCDHPAMAGDDEHSGWYCQRHQRMAGHHVVLTNVSYKCRACGRLAATHGLDDDWDERYFVATILPTLCCVLCRGAVEITGQAWEAVLS